MILHTAVVRLVAEKGKFSTWCIETVHGSDGNPDRRYEVRQQDVVIDQFDNEGEAIGEMVLQDRIEVQNRGSGPGM